MTKYSKICTLTKKSLWNIYTYKVQTSDHSEVHWDICALPGAWVCRHISLGMPRIIHSIFMDRGCLFVTSDKLWHDHSIIIMWLSHDVHTHQLNIITLWQEMAIHKIFNVGNHHMVNKSWPFKFFLKMIQHYSVAGYV